MIRKPAETDVPMIEPILLKAPNLERMADAVAATTMEVIVTILRRGNFDNQKREEKYAWWKQLR